MKNTPYGHGRYEYLSGLMVAVLIMVIGVELLKAVWIRYFIRQRLNSAGLLSVCLRFRFCFKTWMALFNTKTGKND